RIHESYLAIAGLNSREDKTVNQNSEALAARQRGHNVRRPPGLGENLCAIGILGAINEADIVRESGRGRKKTYPQENKESIAKHCTLLGPGTHRATEPLEPL